MTTYTETTEEQWILAKKEAFDLVQVDRESLPYLVEYIKKQYQQEAVVRQVRGDKCSRLASLMDEWAAALQFPLHFGENLNALVDCLRGLPVTHNACQVIVVTRAQQLLSEEQQSANYFWEALQYVVQLPLPALPKPFHLILQVETEADQNSLQTQLQQWGITCDYWQGDWARLYLALP